MVIIYSNSAPEEVVESLVNLLEVDYSVEKDFEGNYFVHCSDVAVLFRICEDYGVLCDEV